MTKRLSTQQKDRIKVNLYAEFLQLNRNSSNPLKESSVEYFSSCIKYVEREYRKRVSELEEEMQEPRNKNLGLAKKLIHGMNPAHWKLPGLKKHKED